jgi:hypothetical protein
MRPRAHLVKGILLCLALVLSAIPGTCALAQGRVALVIGNSAYTDAPLANPANDAALMAATLRDLGFDVIEHTDTDQNTMKRAIRDFGDHLERSGRDTIGLFYYAGHGIQVDGVNYLVPVNAVIERESDVEIDAVSAQAVLATLDFARNRLNLVIVDACRNNPYARSFRSASRGLARMDAPQGTLLAYATAPGEVAADGTGENSPYTAALVEAMQRPAVPVEQMFKYVRREVMSSTDDKQVPWESSSLTGDFYFVAGEESDQEAAGPVATVEQVDREALFWDSIRDTEQAEDFREYLRLFPNGLFAGLAAQRIEALTGVPAPELDTVVQAQAEQIPAEPGTADVGAEQPTTVVRAAERESNNKFSEANYVPALSRVIGRITPKGDTDWYRVSVRHHGELAVRIGAVPENLDINFRVWTKEKEYLTGWYTPLAVGGETSGIVDFPAAGVYFLEVVDGNHDNNSPDPYSLDLSFTPSIDPYEPNNSFGMAPDVTPNQTWRSTILPKGDSDWYRVVVDHHGELAIAARRVPANLDVHFRVWTGEKAYLTDWIAPLAEGGNNEAIVDLPAPGAYVIEIRDGGDDNRSIQPIDLQFAFTPSVDSYEPNGAFGTAAPLAPGQSIQGTILPKGDSDWYRVDVDEQGALDIAISDVPENLDMNFRVWTSDKNYYTGWHAPLAPGGENRAVVDLVAPGSYILEVRDGRDDGRSMDSYTLALAFTPTRDRLEPNNSFGAATPLKLGATVSATILPKGDADWYRLSVPQPGDLNVVITGSAPNLDINFRLWNADKAYASGWFAPLAKGGNSQGSVPLPASGEYMIEVRDGGDDDRSIQAYSLSASM